MRNCLKLLFGLVVIFITLVFISTRPVIGCGGTFACGDNVSACWNASGNQCQCGTLGCDTSPSLRCQAPAGGSLDRACGAAGAVCAYGCAVSGCILVDGCFDDTAPTPTTDPCGGGPKSFCGFGGGYFCCGSNMVCTGSPPNFGCSPAGVSTPTPVPPTPTPTGSCTPGTYCNGTFCDSATSCHDLQYDASCGCTVPAPVASGVCTSLCGGGTAVPTAVPTSPPSGGACGVGSHIDSALCGGCCADGTSCTAGFGGTYSCTAPPASSCAPNGSFNSTAFIDANGNNLYDGGLESRIPFAGSATINYTDRAHQADLFGNTIQMADPGSGSVSLPIDVNGFVSSAFSYNGTLTYTNSSSGNAFSGGMVNSYTCWFGGATYTHQFVAGTGPWSVNLDTYGVDFVYAQNITFGGKVFIDTNGNGVQDGGEAAYTAGTPVTLSGGNGVTNTNSSGNYTFSNKAPGTYTLTLTVPAGYSISPGSTNPRTLVPTNNQFNINFGIRPAPSCAGGLLANPTTVNPGASATLSVTSCTNVPTPPPPPFVWTPDPPGAHNPPPTIGGQTDTPTSSTTTWTAPACPVTSTVYTPQVVVGASGNTTSYTTNITVPATYTVTTNVRSVTDTSSCNATSGSPYKDAGGNGVLTNITNIPSGGTINTTQTTDGTTGQTQFQCLAGATNYQVSLAVPSGYSVVGINGGTASGSNGITVNNLAGNTAVTFCIAPLNPWFQTDIGDVRFLNLTNPVPPNKYASLSNTYPGIFYSSDSTASFGVGAASAKNWVINNEYSYNANTQNRNGGMSYDFYKNKTRKDGVSITSLVPGTLDTTAITGSGVYESNGDLTINNYTHTPGRRVVILVNGNVTINTPISIPNLTQQPGLGNLFIVAAHGNITIDASIGTPDPTNAVPQIEGYYTAQKDIIIDGGGCSDGTTSDRRLNVGGTLIANSLKPFATNLAGGKIINKRSLCTNNLQYPSLYISSRPDFLTQLTDFYKTSYTKWQEVNP